MSGERDLDTILANLAPVLATDKVIFCSLPVGAAYAHLEPLAFIREHEGLSLVVNESVARQHGVAYDSTFRGISLTVHSSLEAVGLTAAIATCLANAGISANVIAGYFHDHIFVPSEQAETAVAALQAMKPGQT